MKLIYLMLSVVLLMSCSSEGEEPFVVSSPRDGNYSATQLTFTLDNKAQTNVSSVILSSKLIDANVDGEYSSNPIYKTTITIVGFPTAKKKSTFVAQTNVASFEGTTTINGVEYRYVGEFTGEPLLRHENQGLILQMFTNVK